MSIAKAILGVFFIFNLTLAYVAAATSNGEVGWVIFWSILSIGFLILFCKENK